LNHQISTSNSPVNHGANPNLFASIVTGAIGYRWTGLNGFKANTQNASTLTVSVWEIGGRKITEKVISLDDNTTNFDTAPSTKFFLKDIISYRQK
jgi:hypothetical protein